MQDFESMFQQSLLKMDEYIATQKTKKQISSAVHNKRHIEINKNHFEYVIKEGRELIVCHMCGAIDSGSFGDKTRQEMIEQRICFSHHHWNGVASKQNPNRLIIDGDIYSDGGNTPGGKYLGFGGHRWYIERDGRVWTTNNLWSGGTIPEEYRHILVDNAKFLTKEDFTQRIEMSDHKFRILAKPVFQFCVPKTLLKSLLTMSANHYDATCQSASMVGGFMFGWRNMIEFGGNTIMSADFRQLDLTLKICENFGVLEDDDCKEVAEFTRQVRQALEASNRNVGRIDWAVKDLQMSDAEFYFWERKA